MPKIVERVKESARLGFSRCVVPKASLKQLSSLRDSVELIGVSTLTEALKFIR